MKSPGIILKIAGRCNINCDYCYMYQHADQSFKNKPSVMPLEIFCKSIDEIARCAKKYGWLNIKLTMHGGEPLLVGKKYFSDALEYTHDKLAFTAVTISLQSNGTLIDDEWISLFQKYQLKVGISLDGSKQANDLHRLDFQGRSTYEKVIAGIQKLQAENCFGGVLAVIDPKASGKETFQHFVDELGITWMDFLLPDGNHEDFGNYYQYPANSYAKFLIEVFDEWWTRQDTKISVRILESIIDTLIGGHSKVESIGCGASHLVVIESDGSLEPLDVLRITGDGFTRQNYYIGQNSFEEFFASPLLTQLNTAATELSQQCQSCRYLKACGGGYFPHRFSKANGFQNPSLYCSDLRVLIEHISQRIREALPKNETQNVA